MASQQSGRYVGPFEVLHSRPIYETPIMKLREDRIRRRGQPETTLPVASTKPRVCVLPLDERGTVTLLREFKYVAGQDSLEAPSGPLEAGEKSEEAALRTLGEEAGLIAAEWVDMGLLHPLTTLLSSPHHLFLARRLSPTRRRPGAADTIELLQAPLEEALRWVLKAAVVHAPTCVLILKAHLYAQRASR